MDPSPSRKSPRPESFLPLRPAELLILHVLSAGEQHGYAIVREVARESEGTVRLHPGALYRMLHRLLGDGLLAESDERPAPDLDDARRRYYGITPLGKAVLTAEVERLGRLVRAARSGGAAPRPRTV